MSNSFSDAVNNILSENKSININQSGKTLVEKVNDIQIDRDGQDKFHREKKLLGPGRFKKWFKRRTLKKSDMTDQEQEQHHQDNRKLTASGVKEDVTPGSVEMVYRDHKVIDTGKEDRYGFQMYDVHHGGKKTHSNVRLRTAKDVLDTARKKTIEKANKKLVSKGSDDNTVKLRNLASGSPSVPKESVEVDENTGPTRTAVNQEFKRVHGKQMDTGAATRHVEKKFNINNVKVQKDNDGNRHVISFEETDATSAADDFLNELSQEFGAENITLDTIMENIGELETLLTSLKEYFGIDESAEGDTILTAHDMASTNNPHEHQAMAVQKIKDLINKERNEETTKESNNGN
tara:strand:+ start:4644 stop:5687 length:1044 start_codon:yes stop_codon:yes gene_type:complete